MFVLFAFPCKKISDKKEQVLTNNDAAFRCNFLFNVFLDAAIASLYEGMSVRPSFVVVLVLFLFLQGFLHFFLAFLWKTLLTRPDTRPSDASPLIIPSFVIPSLAPFPSPRHSLSLPLAIPLPLQSRKWKKRVFAHSRKNGLRTDLWTDRRTYGWTHGPMDPRTD